MLLRAGVAEPPPSSAIAAVDLKPYRPRHQRHHPQPRKGVKRRELHIYVLRREWVKGAHAAADDDKSRKGLHSFLKSLRNARNNYSNGS